jgi:hypothetical protein
MQRKVFKEYCKNVQSYLTDGGDDGKKHGDDDGNKKKHDKHDKDNDHDNECNYDKDGKYDRNGNYDKDGNGAGLMTTMSIIMVRVQQRL